MTLTIDQIQVADVYLKRFGNPVCYILKSNVEDGGITPTGKRLAYKFHSKKYGLEEVFKVNDQYPIGLHYTPNGNFGDNKVETGKMLLRKTGFEGSKPYRRAMVADFDKKDCDMYESKTHKEYLDYLLNEYINVGGLPIPDYIQESAGGYHIIWIIKEEESRKISRFLVDGQVSNAFFFIQATAYGGVVINPAMGKGKIKTITGIDIGKQRFLTSASIRMPGSQHWKTGSPIEVKLYRVIKEKFQLFVEPIMHAKDLKPNTEHNEITYDLVQYWSNKYDEVMKSEKVLRSVVLKNNGLDKGAFEKIDDIRMPELLEKLAGLTMSYGGRHSELAYNSSTKSIEIRYEDGSIHRPSGYKYWEEANMIWEFNGNKSIDERPQGKPSRFLYYFFNRNWKLVDEFIHKEFGIKLIIGEDSELGVLRHSTVGDNDIMCLPTKIILKKLVTSSGGSTIPKVSTLFNTPFTIIGKGKTSFSGGQGETEDEELVFIIKKYNSDETLLLKCYSTKRLWNLDNIARGMFFYGDDNDLGLFYDAIFGDKSIPEYEIVATNGFFDGYYVFGGKVYPMEEYSKTFNICKSRGNKFDIHKGKDISIKDFIRMGTNVWDDKIFIPTILQAIALAGANIWDRVDNFNQFPGLLLTGYTGSGKTVLHETISLSMGYEKKARSMSISRTSPQPLKQAGIDGCILHLEEFTDPIKQQSEDILRDILNRSISSKGTPGKNIVWKYRSTPFVDGESMPQSESVANRFVIIPVDKAYWKGDTNSINKLQKYSFMKELYTKRYELGKDPELIGKTITKRINKLTSEGINPRTANVWATVFTINELFEINYDEKKLLEYAKSLMKDVGIDQGDGKRVTPFMRFRIFMAEAIMERKVSISEQVYDKHSSVSFIFNKEFITKHISEISKIINEINTTTMAWYEEKGHPLENFTPIMFMTPMLTMTIRDVDVSPTDEALRDINDKYFRVLPRGVYTYYDGHRETKTVTLQ